MSTATTALSPFRTLATLHGAEETPQSSFGSRDEDYPQPMAAAAYHGVAGELVQLIAPQTEADPAALLFQLLAAFGNIIGRNAYMMVGRTRHHFNLFGVLVGQSSKSRKGTSWNEIGDLLERTDSEWRSKCVTSGLSSGEGLIWAVRDEINETKPIKDKGRHTGQLENVITDPGIADKRLFVIEGEFARTLKVMEGQTNILSAVTRQAWDDGNLRSLVKNSPATATGAHISVVGHITRDELRRLLNQTEAANGYANRFCWLAVKRSKCLPEGGRIDTVNFNDVVTRLHSAIEFGREVGEVTRDEAAGGLWREVYPGLSEGKPGMLGAVTGRAEAQVMRLSALYALLDQSRVIQPAHHYAALAVWNYCEQSARWIFGTSSGNTNADKIETALKRAGIGGMTRTEIHHQVFNRNISADSLSDAFHALERSGAVTHRRESTSGAPSERWFARKEVTNLTN